MGVAAYARGSALIARHLDHEARPVEFIMMDELNALPKKDRAPVPFGEIRFVAGRSGWWAECPRTGFGYHYPTLREAVRSFRVEVYGYLSGCWLARPRERAS